MRIGPYKVEAQWGHLAGVSAAAAFCIWYMFDTWGASSSIQNVGMIIPAGIGAIILYCFIVAQSVTVIRSATPQKPDDDRPEAEIYHKYWRTPAFMVLLGFLLSGMTWVGFDVSAILFMMTGLFILGERRWAILLFYSVGFGLGVTYFFKSMLSLPILTVIL